MQTPTGVRPNAITHSSPAHRFEPDNRHPKQRLLQLDATLTDREQAVVRCVERLRLLQARQIERLYFAEAPTQFARARACRRVLAGLVEEGLLRRLERRVGGV